MKNPSSKTSKGFTLIELLVAMAITTIIITILVSITGLSLDTWNRSRSQISASRQGKAMIDSMTRDFESMIIRKGNKFEWLYAKSTPPTESPNNNTYASPNAADLVFFSAATDRYNGNIGNTEADPDTGDAGEDKGGDVSTIAYQLKYKNPIGSGGSSPDAFKTFVLYRKIINPDVTFTDTLGIPFTENGIDLLTKAQNAVSDSPTGNEIDSSSNFICENVYQFTTTFHVEVTKADGTLTTAPIRLGEGGSDIFKIGGGQLQMDTVPSGIDINEVKAGRLTAVEISLTVLTNFGLKQMKNRDTIDDLDDFIAENSYQFSKLIPVPGG
ncbi:MAG: prepilin-type N-terminal cleavage/methylation domain-containing protein [Verrucomicrobia bacterium]|jgi:prepilin-type N-terminal cleavage/methylation domain-containing protein|nr:prepilin-type N-terminal cleavage/methylation domain-containing protein [Verrucomicrobiota bacterium]|tara:strand:+ start:2576 stop:3556 length:981 start_codon:yes stop_codon:yes gene_type:complete